ncbi:MAG: NAD(+) kinase [Litorivicinus sp.]
MYKALGLIIRPENELATATAHRLRDQAIAAGLSVVVTARETRPEGFDEQDYVPLNDLAQHCDLAAVIGGDGSLLGAARALARSGVPVLGINRGNLGFLTDIHPDDASDALNLALEGKGSLDQRALIGVTVTRDGQQIAAGSALNDIVLHKGSSARMLSFDVHHGTQQVYQAKADGLIVATPTGSTAYSLSAGGPILHPSLSAWVVVPMFPHTLADRPLVLADNQALHLSITDQHQALPLISCDGQTHISVMPGDQIQIEKLDAYLNLLHVDGEYDYFAVCREKLGWATRLGD